MASLAPSVPVMLRPAIPAVTAYLSVIVFKSLVVQKGRTARRPPTSRPFTTGTRANWGGLR